MKSSVKSVLAMLFVLGAGAGLYDFAKLGGRGIQGDVRQQDALNSILADRVVVEKAARRISLYRDDKLLHSYAAALGGNPLGHKQREGDRKTPEGVYKIDFANRRSAFHLALRISYPDENDRRSAREKGVPPGSDIMIHGLPNGLGLLGALHRIFDWTDGCIAVTNNEMEEIWRMVAVGTPVHIIP